jgi:hypothetical protein
MATKKAAKKATAPAKATARPAAKKAATPAKKAAAPVRRIKVRATQMGYYGEARRREGDVFRLTDPAHFSEKWMEYVDPRVPEKTTTVEEALREEHQEIREARERERSAAPGTEGDPIGDGDDEAE